MDLTTPPKRTKAKRQFQRQIGRDLSTALYIRESMGRDKRRAFLAAVDLFNGIRSELEDVAVSLGISDACKSSISDCRGECCRWHFPKNLAVVDFLITVCRMRQTETDRLLRLVGDSGVTRFQCLFLRSDGCFFSFKQRPFACTVAYPCHAGESYHRLILQKQPEIDDIRSRLEKIIAETR